jgi:hypothetical protein
MPRVLTNAQLQQRNAKRRDGSIVAPIVEIQQEEAPQAPALSIDMAPVAEAIGKLVGQTIDTAPIAEAIYRIAEANRELVEPITKAMEAMVAKAESWEFTIHRDMYRNIERVKAVRE